MAKKRNCKVQDAVAALEAEQKAEAAKLRRRMARKAKALQEGLTPKQLLDLESTEKTLNNLIRRGIDKPTHSVGNAKVHIRVPMDWRQAMLDHCKERKISQSDFIRSAIKRALGPAGKELSEVKMGRPAE